MQIGRVVNFEKEYQPLPPGTKIPYDASMFLHARPNFKKKIKKPSNFKQNFDLSLRSFPPKMQGLIQIFLYGQTSLVID